MGSVWRGLKIGVAGLAGLVLLVCLAWAASNRADDAPMPEPEALRLPPASQGTALFFQLQGLMAPAGESPEAAGRQEWQHVHAVPPPAVWAWSPPKAGALASFQVGPLTCAPPEDCQKILTEAPERIVQQLQPMALLGERCQAALADPRYEEPRAPVMNLNTPLPGYLGAVNCAKWFKGQALLAAHAGDAAQTLAQLGNSRRLLDAVLKGTESLVGKMVLANIARGHLDALAAVVLLRTGWAAELAPLAAAWPAEALGAQRWMQTERAFVMGTLETALTTCGEVTDLVNESVFWLACKSGLGLLPHATRQALDRAWLEPVQRAQQGLDVALDAALAESAQPPQLGQLAWRNTLGARLVDVARPSWAHYLARQADMDLQRQAVALLLAAQAQQVLPAERNAWLDRQGLPTRMRARLNWEAGGAVLSAKPWQAELPGTDPRRNPWRVRTAV
jgi:hypothetical protein